MADHRAYVRCNACSTIGYHSNSWANKLEFSHYCMISVLTLFIVIAASRTVNKNVSIAYCSMVLL